MRINRIKTTLLATVVLCLSAFHACIDDKVVDFKKEGVQITTYLKENPYHSYTEFLKWMEITGIDRMLNARGNYTCFVPTDAAIKQYYQENGVESSADLEVDKIADLIYGHIIRIENPTSEPIVSKNFPNGTISHPNMRSRFLQISYDEMSNPFVNQTSKIIFADQDNNKPYNIQNGVVHTIDRVLEPSRSLLTGLATTHADDGFATFVNALTATGLIDSLQTSINEEYDARWKAGLIPETIKAKSSFDDGEKTPETWLVGFTVLMESDKVFEDAGIYTLEDLRKYAEEHMVPKKPEYYDNLKDRRNSLNRFIAYHILDRTWDLNDFIPEKWLKFYAVDRHPYLVDYTTTLSPYGMIEVRRDGEDPILNRRKDGSAIRVTRIAENNSAENGFFHALDGILVYDQGMEDDVLNKRIRLDITSLLPELHTNRLAGNCSYTSNGGIGGRTFPKGYFKNLVQLNETTQIQYGGPMNNGWNNLHLDEILTAGKYDLKLRIPPLPTGMYEIRMHHTANPRRAVLQIYLDKEPLGIPLDMTKESSHADIGYVKPGTDSADPDGLENDKMMRNRGYMKGPAGVHYSLGEGSLRMLSRSVRRVLTTARLDCEQEHWLRFKSVEEADTREFMLDFVEFIPTSCLEEELQDIY